MVRKIFLVFGFSDRNAEKNLYFHSPEANVSRAVKNGMPIFDLTEIKPEQNKEKIIYQSEN